MATLEARDYISVEGEGGERGGVDGYWKFTWLPWSQLQAVVALMTLAD